MKGSSIEYTCDVNDNLTKDLNKGITQIRYNSLNLPTRVNFNHTSQPENEYTYAMDGSKLQVNHKKSSGGKVTDYVGNMIYEGGSLKRILVDGGFYEEGKYYFYLRDHLGNNRVVADASGSAIQVTHYYPFGMSFAEGYEKEGIKPAKQPYKYNGKELDGENSLNWYDYEARQLAMDVPRFTSVDPHAEKKPWISPYVYCSDNPINRIDPDGRDDYYNEINGKHLGTDDTPGTRMRLISQEKFSDIKNNSRIGALARIEGLQAAGRTITIDEAKIQSDLQSIADLSFGDNKLEQQIYIILDTENAEISSYIGASGRPDEVDVSYYEGKATGASLVDMPGGGRRGILLGQVHTHPKSMEPNTITLKEMSDKDKSLAMKLQIPIYGIDAIDKSKAGFSVNIHRVNPSGTKHKKVGKTSANFNIGKQALGLWGGGALYLIIN